MTETEMLSEGQVEMWRKRAQSVIDWNNGVPRSCAGEGEVYISALLRNIPPETILALCVKAQENTALREQLARCEGSRRVHELDNHHNALACGYCAGPLKDELTRLQSQLAQVEKERNSLQVHVEERDSLLDSQAARIPYCLNCWHAVPHNGPAGTVDDACTYEGCNCGYYQPASPHDAATSMRSQCVEKVLAVAEDYSDAWAKQALKDAAREINSLPLEQGEQEKQQ